MRPAGPNAPACPFCEKPFAPSRFLESVTGYSSETDSGGATCPECGRGLEFRIGRGSLEIGYTYWAGSMHFEAVRTSRVPRLKLERSDGAVAAVLGDVRFPFPAPRIAGGGQ